jgi:hypothetical protein
MRLRARWLAGGAAVAALAACGSASGGPTGPSASPVTTLPVATSTPQATPTPTPEPALPPAAVPPASGVSECSVVLQIGADGNASPVFCPDGGINVMAWTYFAKLNTLVMALSSDADVQQVETAMCTDLKNSTIPIETSAGQLAFRYYGWQFAGIGDITTAFPGFCPQR